MFEVVHFFEVENSLKRGTSMKWYTSDPTLTQTLSHFINNFYWELVWWELTSRELISWEVDLVGVDLVGVDFVGVDLMGMNHFVHAHNTL